MKTIYDTENSEKSSSNYLFPDFDVVDDFESFDNFLKNSGINVPPSPVVTIEEDSDQEKDKKNNVNEMNVLFELKRQIYQDVLAPELTKNEKLKRKHKTQLMNKIFHLLKWQFFCTYLFVSILLLAVVFSTDLGLAPTTIKIIVNFIKFYITSIVVELISILFFIVKSVFDKSIVDLFSNFDGKKKKKNKSNKE